MKIAHVSQKCPCRDVVMLRLKIPADLSCTGQAKWRDCRIDKCLASIVTALQAAGIDMRGSCCGHGERPGEIHLADGRMLLIRKDAQAYLAEKTA